jgi:hypothetical protein
MDDRRDQSASFRGREFDADDELVWLSAPLGALRALTELRAALDALEAALVDQARLAGDTWPKIGAALGVSRPTAHRRHSAHDPIAERRRRLLVEWQHLYLDPGRHAR